MQPTYPALEIVAGWPGPSDIELVCTCRADDDANNHGTHNFTVRAPKCSNNVLHMHVAQCSICSQLCARSLVNIRHLTAEYHVTYGRLC